MPIRPAPRKPAASPPSMPPRLKKPPVAGAAPGRAKVEPGWPGVVIERSIGRAAFGAVAVGGGAAKVRLPRLPALKRGAASADTATKASVAAPASNAIAERKRKRAICFPCVSGQGRIVLFGPLYGARRE